MSESEKREEGRVISQEELDQVQNPSQGEPVLPTKEADLGDNPDLLKEVVQDNELKQWFVQYVGDKYKPENGTVTVALAVQAFMEDFPEFLMVVAEENWIRGYKQGVHDSEAGVKAALQQAKIGSDAPQKIEVPQEVVDQMVTEQSEADAEGDE
jgi:hypothetical protein